MRRRAKQSFAIPVGFHRANRMRMQVYVRLCVRVLLSARERARSQYLSRSLCLSVQSGPRNTGKLGILAETAASSVSASARAKIITHTDTTMERIALAICLKIECMHACSSNESLNSERRQQ